MLYLFHVVEHICLGRKAKLLWFLHILLWSYRYFSKKILVTFSRFSSENSAKKTFSVDLLPRNQWDEVQTFFSRPTEARSIRNYSQKSGILD
jgi:hypothetical protein